MPRGAGRRPWATELSAWGARGHWFRVPGQHVPQPVHANSSWIAGRRRSVAPMGQDERQEVEASAPVRMADRAAGHGSRGQRGVPDSAPPDQDSGGTFPSWLLSLPPQACRSGGAAGWDTPAAQSWTAAPWRRRRRCVALPLGCPWRPRRARSRPCPAPRLRRAAPETAVGVFHPLPRTAAVERFNTLPTRAGQGGQPCRQREFPKTLTSRFAVCGWAALLTSGRVLWYMPGRFFGPPQARATASSVLAPLERGLNPTGLAAR